MFVVVITDVGGRVWVYGPFNTKEQAQDWKHAAAFHCDKGVDIKNVMHPNPK